MIDSLKVQARVIGALVVRDMRTRFGRTIFGPLIIVAWPLSHALVLLVLYSLVRKIAPIGTNSTVFFATGILPYILCLYPARFIMIFSIHFNRGLLSIPVIKPLDLVVSQAISQTIVSFWVGTLFIGIVFVFGIEVLPERPVEAIFAILATIYFGAALGCLGGVIYGMLRAWLPVQILVLIAMYFTSGALFLPEALPQTVRNVIWFNPLFHCVEWFRTAYYNNYGYGMLSREYLISVSTIILWFSLIIERGLRGRLMHA